MISEISYSSLKNSHQIRDYEEKKTIERRRNILYLIAQYLKDEGYCETLSALSNEAQLTNQYQICDNVDLPSVLQDFESYYYVRFQKYPKICKKLNCEDLPYNVPKKCFKIPKKPVQEVTTQNAVPKPTIKSQSVPKVNQISPRNSLKRTSQQLEGITVLQLGSGNVSETALKEEKQEKILKPLGGFGNQNAEWMSMAEIITKDIFVKDPNVHWDDIMGLDEAKRLLKEAVVYPIKYPELFSGILTPWKGLLLFGPPGTGKTLLAKAVATECKTTFFNISASSIVSKWRGDSEKLVRVMFDLARYHAPSTIFLDELDALASKRDGGSHSSEHEASRRLKTELLIQLDGLSHSDDQVFLLATSNLPWELDPAMLRRLDKRILVDVPNLQAREAMFRHYLPKTVLEQPVLKCDIYYEFLAKETEGYSGSDIRLVCKETAMQAIRKVFEILDKNTKVDHLSTLKLDTISTHDVQNALDKTKPSASHLIKKYKAWQDRFGST